MNSRRFDEIERIFTAAADLDAAARQALLAQECGDDAELRGEIETLLAHDHAQTLLTRPLQPDNAPQQPASGPRKEKRRRLRAADRLLSHLLSSRRWRNAILLAGVLLLTCVGGLTHWGVKHSLRQIIAQKLQTVLAADTAALEIWMEEKQGDAAALGRRPDVRSDVERLSQLQGEPETLASLRSVMNEYEQARGKTIYAVIDRHGHVLAASRDSLAGAVLDDSKRELLAPIFTGRSVFMKPGLAGDGRKLEGHADAPAPLVTWACAPVEDSAGLVVAALCLGMAADEEFAEILRIAQSGETGETYIFNRRGIMLSESRFNDQLRRIGLIPPAPDSRSAAVVQLRDPGVDLTRGRRPSLPLSKRPLTLMAQAALSGDEQTLNVDGYRDYRGVRVVGAWCYLPQYHFGMATETDYAEAYAPLWYPIYAMWMFMLVLLAGAVAVWAAADRLAASAGRVSPRSQVGRYTLVRKIGEGGMGVVWEAQHALLRRPTAVKLLKHEQFDAAGAARFEREVQLASRLTHPNTIEIYDYGRTLGGAFYYAMELLPGVNLDELVSREGPLPPARVVHILRQVSGSLREMHAQQLVHRDIKPGNIMLCRRGGLEDFVKVLDFGLAKSAALQTAGESLDGTLAGTPLYIAPERLLDPGAMDPRSDIYAVGAVAYRLLTGRPLFTGDSTAAILEQVLHSPPRPPGEVMDPPPPPGLDQLIHSCLAKDPACRPQCVEDLLERLAACTQGRTRANVGDTAPWA